MNNIQQYILPTYEQSTTIHIANIWTIYSNTYCQHMNNIQEYILPTYEHNIQRAFTKSCTYKNHIYIPCDHPQVNNTDLTCENTAPHNCPHSAQHSETKFVHINNSITVLWPQRIKPLQVPLFLFCVVLSLSLELSPYYQSYREIKALSEWILF
jgi:hypothetical protein